MTRRPDGVAGERRSERRREPGFALVEVREAPAPCATSLRAITLTLRWATGPAAEFTGLDVPALEALVRTLHALDRPRPPRRAR